MARQESDREDLIREATGLVDRVEYEVDFVEEPIVVGFRRDGSASFFFGQAQVYQFNSQNQLRRGYLNDKLVKAERGSLVTLTRHRTETEVQLVRHEMSSTEEAEYLNNAAATINNLKSSIEQNRISILREVSANTSEASAHQKICDWLQSWNGQIEIASTPSLKLKPRSS